jgi:hypothetical protein
VKAKAFLRTIIIFSSFLVKLVNFFVAGKSDVEFGHRIVDADAVDPASK